MKRILTKMTLIFGAAGLFVMLFAPSSVPAQSKAGQVVKSGEIRSGSGTIQAQLPPPKSATFKNPPDQPPHKIPKSPDKIIRLDPPVDPSARLADIRPMNAETVVRVKSETDALAPQAPGTFAVYRNSSLAAAPVVSGQTLNTFIPLEPSVANNGRVVFYTSNSYGALSGDGGQTYNYINPFDYFPADGTNDPINGGFGGDQYVFYERTRGLMFWLLQYQNDGTTNRQRLCVTRSQSETLVGGCSTFYDFTPASFNIPTPAGAGGTWLDFPDMAVSSDFLYLSSNVFCTSGCPGNQNIGAVVWRIALNNLRTGSAAFNFYYDASRSGFRFSQGAGNTMYWATHITTSQIRIYRWADNSGTIATDDVNHAAYNIAVTCISPYNPPGCGPMIANSPDGTNFAGNADSRIQGAWVAGGVIGFMWNAAQGGGFNFPHVQVLRFNEANRSLLSQGQIFNAAHAFLYPSVQPNARGHLGGTMAWGGGAFYPNALAWIADDFNNNTITPLENVTFATGAAGPNEPNFGVYDRWGDYLATRIHRPFENTWIGTGFVLQTSATGNVREPHYTWFGRERDTPPAANTIYVDRLNTSGFEDGTAARPYNTITEGNSAASPGDTIIIRGGNYNETVEFKTAVTVINQNGAAIIGKP